ncbi:hypothetical protein [Nocardia sp. NPDC004750]
MPCTNWASRISAAALITQRQGCRVFATVGVAPVSAGAGVPVGSGSVGAAASGAASGAVDVLMTGPR